MSTKDLLRIYLRDHHAGAVAGNELAKRSAKSNEGTPFGTLLAAIERELDEDLTTVERIMERLEVSPARGKDAAAWTVEKLGRLKLNGSVTKYSPLSRVLELEGLSLVLQTRKGLLSTMEQLNDERLDVSELTRLKERVEDQQRRIDEARREAVSIAFSGEASVT